MKNFNDIIKEFINLQEDNVAGGAGGVFTAASGTVNAGEHGGSFGNTDFYNPGSAILAKPLGMKTTSKKKKKKGKGNSKMAIQRRAFPENLWLDGIHEDYVAPAEPVGCLISFSDDTMKDTIGQMLTEADIQYELVDNSIVCGDNNSKLTSTIDKIRDFVGEEAFERKKIAIDIAL